MSIAIFEAAVLCDPAERDGYMREACAGDSHTDTMQWISHAGTAWAAIGLANAAQDEAGVPLVRR